MTFQILDKKTMKSVREYFPDFQTFDEVMGYFASEYFLKGVRWGQWDLDDFVIRQYPEDDIDAGWQHRKMWRCNSCGNPEVLSLAEVVQHTKDTQHYRVSHERWFR